MKKLLLLIALGSVAGAEPTGFSPTLPFGIPESAHRSVEPANNASQAAYNYNQGYGYYYYWGGGGSGMASPGSYNGGYGATLPTYSSAPQKGLDSYNRPEKRKRDTLPGY
ncbi:MAG: hypothetical protein J0I12_22365 [Candidatus Eremiobacteraeota bacterium]|nr:hypothetical protein [Candidatus Eremiobacteraeota bacterium]